MDIAFFCFCWCATLTPQVKAQIGELARRADLRPSAIRYYESIGLFEVPARVAGKRRYDERALQRLSVIAASRDTGLALEDIAELFKADDPGGGFRASSSSDAAETAGD